MPCVRKYRTSSGASIAPGPSNRTCNSTTTRHKPAPSCRCCWSGSLLMWGARLHATSKTKLPAQSVVPVVAHPVQKFPLQYYRVACSGTQIKCLLFVIDCKCLQVLALCAFSATIRFACWYWNTLRTGNRALARNNLKPACGKCKLSSSPTVG